MADFCKQCSEEMWGHDNRDLAASEHDIELGGYKRLYTLCEECGPTMVDRDGKCIGACRLKHGDVPVQTLQQFVDGEMPR